MERIAQFFGPLRTLEPSQWVLFADRFPRPVAIFLVVIGVAIALFASFQAFRFVAAPLGAIIGLQLGAMAAPFFHVQPSLAAWVSAAVLGGLGGVLPPLLVFVVFGGVGAGLATRAVDADDFWLAFLPGFFVCGGASMFALRTVEAVVSGIVGGSLIVWGLIRLFGLTGTLSQVPSLALGLVGIACLASVVFQLKVRPTPEEAEAGKARRAAEKRKKAEDRERMERFRAYGRKRTDETRFEEESDDADADEPESSEE
jgi:hypothetical protein